MKIRMMARNFLTISRALAAGLGILALYTLLINLSWFDEPLHPELAALTELTSISVDDNAYVRALGFLAARDRRPQRAGQQILSALRDRYEHGQRIALGAQELEGILGGSNVEEIWRADFESLTCNARLYMNCAERIIEEVAQADSLHPRLGMLLDRYSALLSEPQFEESRKRDASSPMPPYRQIMDVARIRLAASYGNDSTSAFLEQAAEDFAFWLRILRESDTLPSKMVSLAGMQNNLDFLSTLMRLRELDESELRQIRTFLRPFTREESDIGEAFRSEARTALLSQTPPIVMGFSWPIHLVLQENATLNEEYLAVFIPMRLRASFSAGEYYRQEAYKPLSYHFRTFPPSLYNLGGKLARSRAWSDAEAYISRVHDQNGRVRLVLLQAEIAGRPTSIDVRDVIQASRFRNPYTHDPMDYDEEGQTVGFECLHFVFHPPNPPDVCGVAIGPAATR